MKFEGGLDLEWLRYRCDGELCNLQPDYSKASPFDNMAGAYACEINVRRELEDITDHNWKRMVVDNHFCHLCPRCFAHEFNKLKDKLTIVFVRLQDEKGGLYKAKLSEMVDKIAAAVLL